MPETDQKITEIIDNEEKLAAKMTAMKEAQKLYALYTQEQVDAIFRAAAIAENASNETEVIDIFAQMGVGLYGDQ